MADARSTQSILDAAGAPVTAAPTVVHVDRAGGARTPPATTHLGGGKHGFSVSNADEALGTIVLMDFGAGAEPRYQVFACHLADGSNQCFAWVLTDEAGALWTAPTPDPTVGLYDDPTGAPRTPPAPVPAVGRHLWSLTPSSADRAVAVELRVDSPAGALPPFLDGSTAPVITSTPPPAPAPSNPPPVPSEGTVVTAPIRWQDYQAELAPPWLRQGAGEAWLRGVGDAKDGLELRLRESVKARFPAEAPLDALTRIGGDRGGLERGVTETEAAWRARLRGAWDVWPWAGTPTGVLRALAFAGYTSVVLVTGTGRAHTLDISGNVVTTLAGDVMPSGFWNGFRVLFVSPLPPSWVPTPPSNGSDEVNTLRRLVKQWKPGHAIFEDMVVVQGNVWGFPATQTWGQPGLTWGGGTTIWTPD
jgi:hypothetical protein